MLKGIYKQYHYSPKAWRELKEVGNMLDQRNGKPTKLGGTRWLPHIERALNTVMKNYTVLLTHMENTVVAKEVLLTHTKNKTS